MQGLLRRPSPSPCGFRRCGSGVGGVAKGPRGGGRDRDQIIRHTIRNESEDFAKRLGLHIAEEGALTPDGLCSRRETFVAGMRTYNAGEGKRMRTWNLPLLIRHRAYHTMDHAWDMKDKDLSAPPRRSRARRVR